MCFIVFKIFFLRSPQEQIMLMAISKVMLNVDKENIMAACDVFVFEFLLHKYLYD